MNWSSITVFIIYTVSFSAAVAFFVISAITLANLNTPGDCTLDISFSGLQEDQSYSLSAIQLFFELDEYRLEVKNALVGTSIGRCFDFCEDNRHTCTNPGLTAKTCYQSCVACRDHIVQNSGPENCITGACSRFDSHA